ncbi:MAG: trypsin-like peptidase domain-containing protein [Planctomycetota bacterium]
MRSRIFWLIPFLPCLLIGCEAPAQQPAQRPAQRPAQHPAQQPGALVERNSPLQVVEPDANEMELRMTPVVRAVQRTADSVVSIYLQIQLARRDPVTEGQGSGVILDESGLVITNWHVVAPVVNADPRGGNVGLVVRLRDGRTRPAQVLSSSAKRDLALLQLKLEPGEKVKAAEIGRSSDLMIGETMIAIGNPQGQANTVTSGVLSAVGRTIQVNTPDGSVRSYSDLMQTDAAINQGNSGGALLDITGKLVGINNAMAMGAENIGFAIPMDVVRREFQRELIQGASFSSAADAPWLGFEVADRDGEVVVTEVWPGSPAAAAGVHEGDVLASMGGQSVRSSIDYVRQFIEAKVAKPLTIALRRNGRDVKVDPLPITREQGTVLATTGAAIEEISVDHDQALVRKVTLAFYRNMGLRRVSSFPSALRIESVQPDSPASAIGLEAGDVLLAVYLPGPFAEREVPITARSDFARLLDQHQGNSLRIAILRGSQDLTGTLQVRDIRRQ